MPMSWMHANDQLCHKIWAPKQISVTLWYSIIAWVVSISEIWRQCKCKGEDLSWQNWHWGLRRSQSLQCTSWILSKSQQLRTINPRPKLPHSFGILWFLEVYFLGHVSHKNIYDYKWAIYASSVVHIGYLKKKAISVWRAEIL